MFGNFLTLAVVAALVTAQSPVGPLPLKPPKHGGVYVIAHRGAHEGIPENTLAAYQKGIDLGVDFVEIDVRTTKDGRFVSIHNATVDGYAAGATGRVRDKTLADLKALDIGARIGPEWAGTRIPTFEEVLDLVDGKCGIYLDLKDAPVPELVKPIQARGMEHDVVWYIMPSNVPELRKACPECIEMPEAGLEKNIPKVIEKYNPRLMAAVWKNVSANYAPACHANGGIVFVDDDGPETWQNLIAWGADGIQTDHPAALVTFLESRGENQ